MAVPSLYPRGFRLVSLVQFSLSNRKHSQTLCFESLPYYSILLEIISIMRFSTWCVQIIYLEQYIALYLILYSEKLCNESEIQIYD